MVSKSKDGSKNKGSLLLNLPIRSKFLVGFGIILLFLLLISSISVKSINTLEDNYFITERQGRINELARNIEGLHNKEESLVNSYSSGVVSPHALNFEIQRNANDIAYIQLENSVDELKSRSTVANVSEFLRNIDKIKPLYYANISLVFDTPSISVSNSIIKIAKNASRQADEIMMALSTWIFTQDQTARNELEFDQLFNPSIVTNIFEEIKNTDDPNSPFTLGGELNDRNRFFRSLEVMRLNISIALGGIISDAGGILSILDTAGDIYSLSAQQQLSVNSRIEKIYANKLIIEDFVNQMVFAMEEKIVFALQSLQNVDINLSLISIELFKIIQWSSDVLQDQNKEFASIVRLQRTIAIFISIIASVFVLLILFLVNRHITRPIQIMARWSEEISEGNLTIQKSKLADRTDEFGKLQDNFAQMSNNLRTIISDVRDTAQLVSSTSEELSSNTEEINATAEEVSAIATSMAKGSTHQAELIQTIVEELNITSAIVDSVINQINANLLSVRDLSEQTNVLSLNTAIEAANAGDFGRGFVVIADNIRKMSTSSKKTTEQISRDSSEILNQLQTTFANIQEKIENIAAVSEETAASAEEVAASTEEMTATMENVSSTSTILNENSSKSLELVNRFKLEDK